MKDSSNNIETAIKNAIKGAGFTLDAAYQKLKMAKSTFYGHLKRADIDTDFIQLVRTELGVDINKIIESNINSAPTYPTGADLARRKAIEQKEDDGLIVVPISAQAGYSSRVIDPVYFNEFRRMQIPGLPYKGDNYRVFEVNGDSMEPTLKQGFLVICERVEQSQWVQIAKFYIHVIVTEDRIMIKRLYQKDKENFVAISDNKDYYSQFLIPIKEIKELWVVVRKVDWEMPPPIKFDIEI